MFEWLIQPLVRSKRRAKKLPPEETTVAVIEGKATEPGSSDSQFGRNNQKGKESPLRGTAAPVVDGRARERGSPDSLRSLLRVAIADAEEIAAGIKMRAQKEAEAEAARIIAQARLESQEIKNRVEMAAQREARDILSEANRKSQILEVEARQKALQFLLGAGDEIGREISEEYKRAYSRLSASLEELMNEGRKIETELERKAARLVENKSLELKGFETMLLRSAEASASAESEEAVLEREVAVPAESEEVVLEREVAVPAEPEEAALGREVAVPAEPEEAALEREVAVPAEPEEAVLEREVAVPAEPEEVPLRKREVAPVVMDSRELYAGEIELIIVPPVELVLVSRFYNYLQTIPELRILYTRGSWDQGTTIIVTLDDPVPLIGIISQAPDVKVTPEPFEEKGGLAGGKSSSLLRGGEHRAKKIKITLEEV